MHSASVELTCSLAAVHAGDQFEIDQILFESLRDRCSAPGMLVGDVLQCRAAGNALVFLSDAAGRIIAVDRDTARFIKVRRIPAGE